jgi:hypothetical protein
MFDRNPFTVWKGALALLALLLLAGSARAYVGPGAGLELVGYAMSLAAWVGVAFSALFLYPLYSLIRRLRGYRVRPMAPAVVSRPVAAETCEGSTCK